MNNLKSIIRGYLKINEFDGLVSEDNDCGCPLCDLAPCDSNIKDCKPGYAVPCDCGDDCLFHIAEEKPNQKYECDHVHKKIYKRGFNECPFCKLDLLEKYAN